MSVSGIYDGFIDRHGCFNIELCRQLLLSCTCSCVLTPERGVNKVDSFIGLFFSLTPLLHFFFCNFFFISDVYFFSLHGELHCGSLPDQANDCFLQSLEVTQMLKQIKARFKHERQENRAMTSEILTAW